MDKEFLISTASKELQTKVEDSLKSMEASCCAVDCDDEKVTREQMYDVIRNMHSYFSSEYNYINSRLNDLYSSLYEYQYDHGKGHTPKLDGAAMTKFLKVMGLEDTYQVVKQSIYVSASDSKGQKTLVIE